MSSPIPWLKGIKGTLCWSFYKEGCNAVFNLFENLLSTDGNSTLTSIANFGEKQHTVKASRNTTKSPWA